MSGKSGMTGSHVVRLVVARSPKQEEDIVTSHPVIPWQELQKKPRSVALLMHVQVSSNKFTKLFN